MPPLLDVVSTTALVTLVGLVVTAMWKAGALLARLPIVLHQLDIRIGQLDTSIGELRDELREGDNELAARIRRLEKGTTP